MKICVVTIYNGSNYGARLQALALRHILEEKGHEVVHLDTGARNPKLTAFKKVVKRLITFDWRKASLAFQWDRGKVFDEEQKEFNTCDAEQVKQMDMVIFGSDEIWNIKRKMIYKYPMLFGVGVENDNKYSYAISINDAVKEDFEKRSFSVEGMRQFQHITVRDNYSKDVLSSLYPDKEIGVVVDPTFLPGRQYYEEIMTKTEQKDYILVYSYGNHLEQNAIEQMKSYAKEHGFKLVSVLGYLPWCDENTPYSTKEVLGLIRDAKVIFTDTFHGAIFSMIFEKEFVIVSKGTKKLTYLLQNFGMEGQKIGAETTVSDILEQKIDYEVCNRRMKELRDDSLNQLNDMLMEAEK